MKQFIFLLCILSSTLCSQNKLFTQYPKYKGELFYKIEPISPDTAMAIMAYQNFGVTMNKGYDWMKSRIDSFDLKAIDSDVSGNIYAVTGDGNRMRIYRSSNLGASWTFVTELKKGVWGNSLNEIDFITPDTGYFRGDAIGFTKTTAKEWRTLSIPATSMQFRQGIGWMAIGNVIYRSTDFGRSWRAFFKESSPASISVNLIDSLVAFYQFNYKTFKTNDGGQNWDQIQTPESGETIFFTADLGVVGKPQGTKYLTTNRGTSWTKIGDDIFAYFLDNKVGYIRDWIGFLARTSNGGVSWDTISTRISLIAHCGQIHISPSGVGVAAKGNFGRQNIFLATTNFGDEWYPVSKNESAIPYLFNFSNDYFAYGVGVDSSRNVYTIIKTIDGGLNWKYQSDLFTFNQYFQKEKPKIIQTVSESTIAVITDSLQIFLSTNSGVTWKVNRLSNGRSYQSLKSVFFIDGITGFVSTLDELYRTTDGGVTWQSFPYKTQPPQFNGALVDLYFQSATTGFAYANTVVLKTTDGGATWSEVFIPSISDSRKLHFRDKQHGLFFSSSAQAYITNDGGKSWTQYTFSGAGDLNNISDLSLLNDTTFWIGNIPDGVIYDNYPYPGYIKRAIVRKQPTSVKRQNNPPIPKLLSVYPNPLRSDQTLTIPLRANEAIELTQDALSVYDALGRKIYIDPVLLRGQGASYFILSGKSFAPGLYFFQIVVNEQTVKRVFTGKFIIAG